MTFGVGPDAIIGEDEGFSIENSFERPRGAPLMKPPKEALPDRKPTRKDRIKKAVKVEAVLANCVVIPSDFFETNGDQQDIIDLPPNAAEILLDRFLDDLHTMALPESEHPTLL